MTTNEQFKEFNTLQINTLQHDRYNPYCTTQQQYELIQGQKA